MEGEVVRGCTPWEEEEISQLFLRRVRFSSGRTRGGARGRVAVKGLLASTGAGWQDWMLVLKPGQSLQGHRIVKSCSAAVGSRKRELEERVLYTLRLSILF